MSGAGCRGGGSFARHHERSRVSPGQSCHATRVRGYVTFSVVVLRSGGIRIGHGRVSTRDQNPAAKYDALTAAGCDQVYVDKASEVLASRPELDRALLSANRAGDELVVTKLDRLGRSLEHLIALSKLWWQTSRMPTPQVGQRRVAGQRSRVASYGLGGAENVSSARWMAR
jgi:hypothetical protein